MVPAKENLALWASGDSDGAITVGQSNYRMILVFQRFGRKPRPESSPVCFLGGFGCLVAFLV